MTDHRTKYWFRPKRYGYGSGLPIAWQGWAVLGAYMGLALVAAGGLPLVFPDPAVFVPATLAVVIPASFVLAIVCALKTEGGWRWRWGGKR